MTEGDLVVRASAGDGRAFEQLVATHRGALRSLVLRLVVHPQDADDLTQEALIAAHGGLTGFRGDSSFRTWLLSIGTRKSIDHLRARKRWATTAQSEAAASHVGSPELMEQLTGATATPGFEYEYREHIAYCFSCVARSLEPEQAAALFLREVFEFTNPEAAKALELSLSTFRHRLAEARRTMKTTFDGLCALVGKQGMCWQCRELRSALPADKRGETPHAIASDDDDGDTRLRRRLTIVRGAKLGHDEASPNPLHDYLLRYMAERFG